MRQSVFNHVVKGLLSQAHPSAEMRHGRLGCLYRGGAEIRCAVGWMIPDSLYSRGMEDLGSNELLENYPALRESPMISQFTPQELELLQQYHDDAAHKFSREGNLASDWQRFIREALANFANDANLIMEV